MSLIARIDEALLEQSNRPFLVLGERRVSRSAFNTRVRKLFGLFEKKGLTAGQHIAVCSKDPLQVASLLIAAFRSGLAVANLNPELTPVERRHALLACKADHVFLDEDKLRDAPLPPGLGSTVLKTGEAAKAGGMLGRLLRSNADRQPATGLDAELASIEAQDPATDIGREAIALLLFTSGTTSEPKVVQLSQRNLEAQLAAFDSVYDYDHDSRILNVLPMHFTDGIMHGPVYAFLSGATLYRPGRFEIQQVEDLLHGIYRDRITHFIVVPAMLSIIDRLHDGFTDAFDTPDFRYIRSSGDRLPETLWTSIESRFNVRVVNTYGLSETVCEATYCGPDETLFRRGTIGKPIGCETRILSETGDEAEAGEPGELLIRGEIIMQGYLDQPELTAQALQEGWFHTGDLAICDEDGFLTIVGRKKTLIISGDVNIQPQDITDVLLTHPAVADATTLGLPDPVWGEQVASAFELRAGQAAVPEAELRAYCMARLAPHKVPRLVTIIDTLPRNPAGKVQLDALIARIAPAVADEHAASGEGLDQKVIMIAAKVFGGDPDDLNLNSDNRNTFGWDSLAHMNLIFAAEEVFAISLSPRDILSISRLEHLRDVIARRLERVQ